MVVMTYRNSIMRCVPLRTKVVDGDVFDYFVWHVIVHQDRPMVYCLILIRRNEHITVYSHDADTLAIDWGLGSNIEYQSRFLGSSISAESSSIDIGSTFVVWCVAFRGPCFQERFRQRWSRLLIWFCSSPEGDHLTRWGALELESFNVVMDIRFSWWNQDCCSSRRTTSSRWQLSSVTPLPTAPNCYGVQRGCATPYPIRTLRILPPLIQWNMPYYTVSDDNGDCEKHFMTCPSGHLHVSNTCNTVRVKRCNLNFTL